MLISPIVGAANEAPIKLQSANRDTVERISLNERDLAKAVRPLESNNLTARAITAIQAQLLYT